MTLYFDFYDDGELTLLLKRRVALLGWQVEDEGIYELMARRARGVPRIALSLLEQTWQVVRSRNCFAIRGEDCHYACRLTGLDDRGLRHPERQYLQILARTKGPMRLNVIATSIGLAPQTVSTTIESFLLRIGLIVKTDKGRAITEDGLQHLDRNPDESIIQEGQT